MVNSAVGYSLHMSAPTEHRMKIAEARNVLGEVIARSRFAGDATVLVNRGKNAAAIVSYEDYATLRELRAYLEELQGDDTPDAQHKARVLDEALALARSRAALS